MDRIILLIITSLTFVMMYVAFYSDIEYFSNKCSCIYPNKINDTCEQYYEQFLEQYPDTNYLTKNNFMDWCYSFKKRVYRYPSDHLAEHKFKLFDKANYKTNNYEMRKFA